MSKNDPRFDAIKAYMKLTRRKQTGLMSDDEIAEYRALGDELAELGGDELLRLMLDPFERNSIRYFLGA